MPGGIPEGDPEKLYDTHDLNVNNLLPGIPGKAGFGSNYKTTLVKLYKVTPEDDTNGAFLTGEEGEHSQALDGKGVEAIQDLVDQRNALVAKRDAAKAEAE